VEIEPMRKGLIGAAVAIALVAGACGSDDDGVSEGDLKEVLIEQGMPEDLADCVSGRLGDISADDLTSEEGLEAAQDAGFECATEAVESDPDFTIPDISIPDISIDLGE
jgi:hypothetical protein